MGLAALSSSFQSTNPQVTVGGQAVPVTYFSQNENGEAGIPIQELQFTTPPGQAGKTASIVISNQFGSTTAPTPMTYLPALQKFPLPGANLTEGVYDAAHQLY